MRELVEERSDLSQQLSDTKFSSSDRKGLEDRITAVDKRIAGVDGQIAKVDLQIAEVAAVPGAIVPRVEIPRNGPPDEVYVLTGIFMFVVLLPLSIAYARRIWKRTAVVVSSIPADLMARVQRIEQAVETSGLEIERIGEGQRFITRLLSEKVPALPPGNSEKRDV
jgi:cytochrome c biogenesis protein ResB